MMSLSSGLCGILSDRILDDSNSHIDENPNNLISLPSCEVDLYNCNVPSRLENCHKYDSVPDTMNVIDSVQIVTSVTTSFTVQEFDETLNNSASSTDSNLLKAQVATATNKKHGNCIWPAGISFHLDFIEIVVTDEEMNALWNTLNGTF